MLLVFLFGIFGIPKDFSGSGLLAAITERIHLGLDLKGGTHLILQVQVNDAVNGDSDRAVERLKEDLRTHKINYTEISKPDPVRPSRPDRAQGRAAGVHLGFALNRQRTAARIRPQLGRGKFMDIHHEAAGPGRTEEPRGSSGH